MAGSLDDLAEQAVRAPSEEVQAVDQKLSIAVDQKLSIASLIFISKPTIKRVAFACRRALKVFGVILFVVVFFAACIGKPRWIFDAVETKGNLMSALFLVGLILVILEDHVGVNKSAVMLVVSATMWTFLAVSFHPHESHENHEALKGELEDGLKDVGGIILFLLPAMGVVESIDHLDGFAVVTRLISKSTNGRKGRVMPILCLLTFFLSAIIDNLTATIVSLKLLRHAAGGDRHFRHSIGGLVVIAANAGGAWSPVGDVTTTMLWLADKISVTQTFLWLFVPSFVAGVFPMLGIWWEVMRHDCRNGAVARMRMDDAGSVIAISNPSQSEETEGPFQTSPALPEVTCANVFVLILGFLCIFMVPVLKTAMDLPPYLGMLLALGTLWFVTDTAAFHSLAQLPKSEADLESSGTPKVPASLHAAVSAPGSVVEALHKLDLTGLLFFAGVLLAVGALDTAGVLKDYAGTLVRLFAGSPVAITSLLGVSSAVVDNVPLVQASIDMFETRPMDDPLWQLTALAAGTGGSILSIGSIAGVTLMTMEGVGYLWYCRRVSLWAALGFAAGIGTYQLERLLLA